ncbi:hypothetical protein GALL_148240 [mine drainage metagenome]|uniref:General secretion pathway GspH domain-containing protein n=1 Tax=mine drainage metagenome TaxID=410659 RepID=A0A1J5SSL5_9ZZZZ
MTQISAPGNSSSRCSEKSPGGGWGFTLIEMLVVLLIMGMLVGLVSTVIRPDDRGLLKIEADRLAQLLTLAASEAQLTGHPFAWTAAASSYRFWRYTHDAGWSEVQDSDLMRRRTLPHGMVIAELTVESMRRGGGRDGYRLEFSPSGAALAFTIDLSLGGEHYQVAGSPIGEIDARSDRDQTHGQAL